MLRKESVNIRSKLKIVKGRPDLTPLVDVLFLLLIFFMLSSSFVQLSGVEVAVPATASVSNMGVEKFVITIDKESNIYFNDQIMAMWDDLERKLNEISAGTVIIRADKDTPFGIVARLLALVEDKNLNAFVLTKPQHEGSEKNNYGDLR